MLWCYSAPMISRVPSLLGYRTRARLSALVGLLSVVCTAGLSAGCSDGDDDGDDSPGSGGGGAGKVTMPITDANQYTSEADLTIPNVDTVAGDITINWSAVTDDLQCHDVVAGDLINASFLRFEGMTHAQVEEELTKNRLDSNKAEFWDHNIPAGEASAKLSVFEKLGGTKIDVDSDFTIDDTTSYLVIVQDSLGLGVGTKSLSFITPKAEGATSVNLGPGCPTPPILVFTPHLDKAKVAAPAAAPWILGWDDVTKDGTGEDIALAGIDKLLIGFYPNMTTAQLEDQFFDIEELANPMWELAINGPDREADLSKALKRNADGTVGTEKFSGFNQGQGAWMVAMTCSGCANPQPVILAILEPSGG